MKKTTKLNNCIIKMTEIVSYYRLTPEQYRYVSKKVREGVGLKVEKRPKRLPDYLTSAEIYGLLNINQDKPFVVLLCDFLIQTGLRISELNNLMIQDIDFRDLQVKVVQGKNRKDRIVPITRSMAHKLSLHCGKRKSGYVFCKNNNTKYSKRALQHIVKSAINRCNFNKDLTTHSLRHTFACLMRQKGMKIQDIQILMGHSSVTTTEIYAKMSLGPIKEEYQLLMRDND